MPDISQCDTIEELSSRLKKLSEPELLLQQAFSAGALNMIRWMRSMPENFGPEENMEKLEDDCERNMDAINAEMASRGIDINVNFST